MLPSTVVGRERKRIITYSLGDGDGDGNKDDNINMRGHNIYFDDHTYFVT